MPLEPAPRVMSPLQVLAIREGRMKGGVSILTGGGASEAPPPREQLAAFVIEPQEVAAILDAAEPDASGDKEASRAPASSD